jgi:hypothetical protein
MMCLDDDEATTPTKRPKRFTISYAQATKRFSFNNESILTPPKTVQANGTTGTTTTSTLTQESLEESLQRFRIETNNSLASFQKEIQDKFTNIEDIIISAITKACQYQHKKSTLNASNPITANSNYSTAQESSNTTCTLTDKVDNLTEIVLRLTQDLKELKAECETDRESSKRNQSPYPTPPKLKTPQVHAEKNAGKSPPSKQQRSRVGSPLSIPPRHPMQQLTAGAMEES